MAYFPKQSGTSQDTFQIGAASPNRFTIDVSGFTSPHTWIIPDGDGVNGYILSTDGAGNLSWIATGSAVDQTTPYYIPSATSFKVNTNKQNLFAINIDVQGTLEIDGILVEVS